MNRDFNNGDDLGLDEFQFANRTHVRGQDRFSKPLRRSVFAPEILRSYGGDIGLTAAAVIQAASAAVSWGQALLVPGLQAAANILLMDKQLQQYNNITAQQRQLLGIAVNNFTGAWDSLLSSQDFENAFPDVPFAAEYVPQDVCCIQGATIECNISHLERAGVYVAASDELKRQEGFTLAIAFDPRFLANVDMISMQVAAMLRGQADVGDVVDIVADTAEASAMLGRIGGNRKMLARNLGISRRSLQAQGRREFREHHRMMTDVILPHGRRASIEDFMLSPANRVAYALAQAKEIQSSLQNLYNRNAQKDPYKMAELQAKIQKLTLKLQFEANKATLVNQFVPNYAAVLQPQVRAVAAAIGDSIPSAASSFYYGPPGGQQGSYSLQGSSGANSMGTSVNDVEGGATFGMF